MNIQKIRAVLDEVVDDGPIGSGNYEISVSQIMEIERALTETHGRDGTEPYTPVPEPGWDRAPEPAPMLCQAKHPSYEDGQCGLYDGHPNDHYSRVTADRGDSEDVWWS